MKKLWKKTLGKGKYHLILLHGWGLNADIWNYVSTSLSSCFTLHLIDLPGFGRSKEFGIININEMAECVLRNVPNKKAIWVGWSLGGLIATKVALMYPELVLALVTVASSPCFVGKKDWPGIKLEIINNFQQQLNLDYKKTVRRFLKLQTAGTKTELQDTLKLKNIMLSSPAPSIEALNNGLSILRNVDLRESITNLLVPYLGIYGYLDNIVPHKIAFILGSSIKRCPCKVKPTIIKKAAHVPFLSHPKEFCYSILNLKKYLLLYEVTSGIS